MTLKIAANILDKNGDFEAADIIDKILIKHASSPIKPSILSPTPQAVSVPQGLTQNQVINPNLPKLSPQQMALQANRGNFDKSIDLLIKLEGGKTDEKTDRGGRTNLGITQREFDAWNKKNKLPLRDVFTIDKETAKQIFKEEYWNIIKGAELPKNIATAILSDALLSGPQDSIKFVQEMLGLKPDGIMGPMTISKIWEKSKNNDAEFARNILDKQKKIYQKDEQAKIYGEGWGNRVDKIKDSIT